MSNDKKTNSIDFDSRTLKDYQILIKKSSSSGGTASERLVLPVSFGEIAKQKLGMDPASRSDTLSAESNLIEKIDVPTSAFDLNLLAGEMKYMTKEEMNVFRIYLGVNRISDPIKALNVACNIKDLSSYSENLDGFEKFRDVPTKDLTLSYDELKALDRDALRAKFHDDDSNSLALYQFATFKINELTREDAHFAVMADLASHDPLWTLKKAEAQLEGDYDNIDGVFGNNDQRNNSSDSKTTEEVVEGLSCDHDGVAENYASQNEEQEAKFYFSENHLKGYVEQTEEYAKEHPAPPSKPDNEEENELVRVKPNSNGNW